MEHWLDICLTNASHFCISEENVMAKPDVSIEPRILDSAKAEFLKNGYSKASLKAICKNAGVTTGALYRRYSGKEGLYHALVSTVAIKFKEKIKEQRGQIQALSADAGSVVIDYIEFVYENFDAFKLLLECPGGTIYCGYLKEVVDLATEHILEIMHLNQKEITRFNKQVSPQFLHMVVNAYFSGFFEPVFQNMNLEDAKAYETQFACFFKAGWQEFFQL